MKEARLVGVLFDKLIAQGQKPFPASRKKLDAPEEPGVYVIYDPDGNVDHVGESSSIAERLRGHMGSSSSYVLKSLDGIGSQLRTGYKFRCLPVPEPRKRMLLQALAIGMLCPRHIGDRAPAVNKPVKNNRISN